MAKLSVTDPVPKFLRVPMDDQDLLYPLLANMLDGDPDEVFRYIVGAVDHQARLPVKPEDKRWFSAKLKEVRVVERTVSQTSNKLLGKKAEIIFDARGDGGRTEEQSILTGWIEYHGFNPEETTWEVALANTIADEAERLIGKDAYICKYLYETGRSGTGGRVRMCIGIREAFGKSDEPADDSSSGDRSSRSSSRSRRDEPSGDDDVQSFYDKLSSGDKKVFKDGEVDQLAEIVGKSDNKADVEDGIADMLELKDSDIREVSGTSSLAEHAVKFFVENA